MLQNLFLDYTIYACFFCSSCSAAFKLVAVFLCSSCVCSVVFTLRFPNLFLCVAWNTLYLMRIISINLERHNGDENIKIKNQRLKVCYFVHIYISKKNILWYAYKMLIFLAIQLFLYSNMYIATWLYHHAYSLSEASVTILSCTYAESNKTNKQTYLNSTLLFEKQQRTKRTPVVIIITVAFFFLE